MKFSSLPVELADRTFRQLDLHDLSVVLRINKISHSICLPILYKHLPDEWSPRTIIQCLKTIVRNDKVARLVQSIHIDWAAIQFPSTALLLLLRDALRRLVNLMILNLELPAWWRTLVSVDWLFTHCPFSLKVFITSMRCNQSLANFLNSQPDIIELGLRGAFESSTDTFTLDPASLPHLKSVRVVYAGRPILKSVITCRPVENVSLGITPEDGFEILDLLAKSSTKVLRRLTMLILAVHRPEQVIMEIANRMPELEALHIVFLYPVHMPTSPQTWSDVFRPFTNLKWFTFISSPAATSVPVTPIQAVQNEIQLVSVWHKSCPTLKSVVLNEERILIVQDGEWSAF